MPITIASDNDDVFPRQTKISSGEIIPCINHDRYRVTVAQWNVRPDALIDVAAYTFNKEADAYGLDPWRWVDGIDEIIDGPDKGKFDVWFASGRSLEGVNGDYPLYIHEKHYFILKGSK